MRLQQYSKQTYIRDAQGNVMAVYQTRHDSLFLDELHLYGSSRLGMIKEQQFLTKKQTGYVVNLPALYHLKLYNFGKKRYELTDWLGNVRVVINDKKTPMGTNPSDMTYQAQAISVSDYYPFGMLARNYNVDKYRFGFNKGSEKDDEITGVAGSHFTTYWREFDTRLGKSWSFDPSYVAYESPYALNRNSPLYFVDPMGDFPKIGEALIQFGRNIGSLFTKQKWGSKTKLAGNKYSVPKFRKWKGLANIFRNKGVNKAASAGRRFNQGWSTVGTFNIGGTGNPINRTRLFDLASQLPRPGDKITGVQVTGNTNGGWISFLRVKGSDGTGGGVGIANSGLQNIFPTWAEPRSPFDFEARSGIIPGLNLLPTIFKHYNGNNLWLRYGLLAGTIGYMNNWFNRVNPAIGPIKALEVQYRSMSNTPATVTLQFKSRVWQYRGSSNTWWKRFIYGDFRPK